MIVIFKFCQKLDFKSKVFSAPQEVKSKTVQDKIKTIKKRSYKTKSGLN